jgi:class 3 adenylate cyclase
MHGEAHLIYGEGTDDAFEAMTIFLKGEPEPVDRNRRLATVLFTDIVGSTERSAALGDKAWREVLRAHHAAVRRELDRHNGTEIATAGDGFFATFDGPAAAVQCAVAAIDGVKQVGLEIRAGVHTGEVETSGETVGGIAVHIGARIGALAGASEVLTSSTVRDLVAGSGLKFEDAGEHVLKGVPERWHLYRVTVG